MAIYIEIIKLNEDFEMAVFKYSLVDGRSGTFRINKATGIAGIIDPLPNDSGFYFARAAHKVRKHLKEDKECLPDKTCWAS